MFGLNFIDYIVFLSMALAAFGIACMLFSAPTKPVMYDRSKDKGVKK